ncbi:MAG: SPW repeat protein [Acidobacteriota bacterium]|nr:SPW repeat protein [Acidobacteriota bacterium]
MRFLPTRVHGIIDWLMGLLLIALPWILGFGRGGAESALPVAVGAAGLIVTFFTNHEYGVVRRIPMTAHLAVDGVAGAVLAASPWVFGFADVVWVPHVILGLTELAAAFVTKTSPADRRATAGRAL